MSERLQYAEACLRQGMSYSGASRAAGVAESDLRTYAPGHAVLRDEYVAPASLRQFSDLFIRADDLVLRQAIALGLGLLHARCGGLAARDTVVNTFSAIGSPEPFATPVTRLKRLAEEVTGVAWALLASERQTKSVSIARHAAFAAVRDQSHLSLPQIGALFGGRDHTTVLSGLRRHEARLAWVECLRLMTPACAQAHQPRSAA